jgi:hypothetical protein
MVLFPTVRFLIGEQLSGKQQPTEWQHIGNQIDAAMIFARADFVNAL